LALKTALRDSLIQVASALRLDELALQRQRARLAQTGPEVLVVEMHETLRADADRLRRQLEWAAERFTLITPDAFFGLWDRRAADPKWLKPGLMFTFDDGRESNYAVAAPLLEEMGVRGLFFVVPDFIGLRGDAARDFYYSRIDVRGLPPSQDEEVWMPMNPKQLCDLSRRGHSVGSHTQSHTNLVGLAPPDLQRQIEGSAEKIRTWTGNDVAAFAWPYAWNAITREAWELIRQHQQFCFSPCPGTTCRHSDSPGLIWRTEIEAYYPEPKYRFMYAGLVNPFWSRKRERLKKILSVDGELTAGG
jgi:peptidoglycan/xylan/chitin deacetylase (PgdA/CDA1 family)